MTLELQILAYMYGHDAFSIPEMADDLGASDRRVRRAVMGLRTRGFVQPRGTTSTNARCYGITHTGCNHFRESRKR